MKERARLREIEALFRLVTDSIPALIVYIDNQERYRYVNTKVCEYLQRDRSQIVGHTLREIHDDAAYQARIGAVRRVLKGEAHSFIASWTDTDGNLHTMNNILFPHESNGKIAGFVSIGWDRTAEDLRAHELEQLRMTADKANKAKSAFLATISHEIRTHLTAILGFIEILRNQSPSQKEHATFLETIYRNSHALLQLINDTLDLSKIEAGRVEREAKDFSLMELLNDVVSLLSAKAREKNIALTLRIEPQCPDTIRTDPLKLRQILVNLLSNALKFTNQGEVTVTARSPHRGNLQHIQIDVADSGIGMTEEQLKKIFEPFTQAETSTSRTYGGTGLGLTISRQLALMLGGDIKVRSQIGCGSVFSLTFVVEATHDTREASAKAPPESMQIPSLTGKRILLAEDSEDNQTLIRWLLERAGCHVQIVSNGQEAIDAALKFDFDLVLMDIQMPVMDGYEATRRLRATGYLKPILALTAHALNGEALQTREAGCDGHLTKPVDLSALLKSIQELTVTTIFERTNQWTRKPDSSASPSSL